MAQTDAKDPKKPSRTLSDADIASERVVRRRTFLGQTGLLVGGALAVAAGVRPTGASAADPDKDGDDPQPDKPGDPGKRKRRRRLKSTDPDARTTDPDARRSTDPDARRAADPDAPRPPPPDPHKPPDSTR